MTGNRYAPPAAQVADVDPAIPARPRYVTWAMVLFWVALTAGIPGLALELVSEELDEDSTQIYYVFIAAMVLLLYGAFVALIICIGRGYRWARIVYAALTAIGYLNTAEYLRESFGQGIWFGVLLLVQLSCDLIALILLFLPASNAWFRVARVKGVT